MRSVRQTAKILVGLGSLTWFACVPGGTENDGSLRIELPEVEEDAPVALQYQEAADEWNVPVDVLKALSYSETGFEAASGATEFDGQPEPFGLFALRGA